MILTGTFYLVAESERLWICVNPETVSLDANNVQSAPLQVRFWAGEGSGKVAMSAYLTLRVESVAGNNVTKLFEYKSVSKISSYDYIIPSDKYATANRISIYAYEDAARTKEIDSKQVNIISANPTPFPRSENWAADNVYKNGEYLKQDNVLYMWTSRVPGNTEISPKEWIEAHQESGLWTPYPYDKLIAAEIALLNFALIGSAVFQDEYMFSQHGKDVFGNPTNDYRKFGTEDFSPNVLIDFLMGSFLARNASIQGEIIAERGSIGGFDIGDNRIGIGDGTSSTHDGMYLYNNLIGFNSEMRQAIIGTFNVLGMDMLGRFIDTKDDPFVSKRGLVFSIRNGYHNYAFSGAGDGILEGVVEGYKLNSVRATQNNEAILIDVSRGKYVEALTSYSDCTLILPRLDDLRMYLGVSGSGYIAFRITVVCRGGSFKLYGRTTDFTVNGVSLDTDQYPYLRNNNFVSGNWSMEEGDAVEVLLTYSDGQYNAYTVSIQR